MSTPVERINEYLRQREQQIPYIGPVIHATHTDLGAELAELDYRDLKAVMLRLARVERMQHKVIGYAVVGRDGGMVRNNFSTNDRALALEFAEQSTQDCKDMGVDWDYRVVTITEEG